jgi:hypothetical protein
MAKRATGKAGGSTRKRTAAKSRSSTSGGGTAGGRGTGSSRSSGSSTRTDPVDALIKLLQSPLVIDLLAVGATAALAAITENRSSRAQGGTGASGRTVKAAGKAAAAAIGRRLATEMEEIRRASQQSRERRTSRRGEAA